jgi:hypothetical protein
MFNFYITGLWWSEWCFVLHLIEDWMEKILVYHHIHEVVYKLPYASLSL